MVTLCNDTVPPASVVKLVSAVAPPTAAPNTVAPEELTTSVLAPSTVPLKRMPAAAEVSVVFVLRVSALP